jgi:hypothetical protein
MRWYPLSIIAVAATYLAIHFGVCLYLPAPIAAGYWVNEMILVKRALADSAPSPRIVALGGSSTLFGIDAQEITTRTNISTMNMGLHAAMRLERLLDIGAQMARPGDIFVLPLEYTFYDCSEILWTDWQIRNMLAWNRTYFDDMPLRARLNGVFTAGGLELPATILVANIGSLVRPQNFIERRSALAPAADILKRYQSDQRRTENFAYSAYNIDHNGDILNNRGTRYKSAGVPATEPGAVCPQVAEILQRFAASLKDKAARVFVAHAPYLVDGAPAPGWQEARKLSCAT